MLTLFRCANLKFMTAVWPQDGFNTLQTLFIWFVSVFGALKLAVYLPSMMNMLCLPYYLILWGLQNCSSLDTSKLFWSTPALERPNSSRLMTKNSVKGEGLRYERGSTYYLYLALRVNSRKLASEAKNRF